MNADHPLVHKFVSVHAKLVPLSAHFWIRGSRQWNYIHCLHVFYFLGFEMKCMFHYIEKTKDGVRKQNNNFCQGKWPYTLHVDEKLCVLMDSKIVFYCHYYASTMQWVIVVYSLYPVSGTYVMHTFIACHLFSLRHKISILQWLYLIQKFFFFFFCK